MCSAQEVSSTVAIPEFTATYVEDSEPVHITSSNFEISASTQPDSVTANITNMYVGDELQADKSGTNITWSYDWPKLTLSGNDSIENYNKVLQSVKFDTDKQNPSDEPRIINISVENETGTTLIAKTTINILIINDPPEFYFDSSSKQTIFTAVFEENSNSIKITNQNVEIEDLENDNLKEFTASIINAQPGDKLQADNTGISINVDFADNVLTLSGEDTIENYIKVINSLELVYDTAETDRIISMTVKDSTRESDILISQVIKNEDNHAVAYTTTFREGDDPLKIAGDKASLKDPSNAGFNELKVVLKNPTPGDLLTANDISGSPVSSESGILIFTGNNTQENYEKVLKSVKFANDSQNPDQTHRIIDFSAKSDEFSTNLATIILAVIAVNDPPENTIAGSQSIKENTPLFFTAQDNPISVADVDALENDIQVILEVPTGLLSISENSDLQITGNSSKELEIKGNLSRINSALDGLRYDPPTAWTGSVILTVKTSDLGNTGIHTYREDTDKINIIVTSSSSGSEKPTAHAGTDQTVDEFTLVTLNGTGSYASQSVSIAEYEWVQTGGPDAALSHAGTEHPFFTAPETDENGAVLTFRLTITDSNGQQDSDTISVKVNNKTETPDNGEIQGTYEEGSIVTLETPDSGVQIVSYEWEQISGPEVFLLNPGSAAPSFVAPIVGTESEIIIFELTTEDINGNINTQEIKIKINDNGIDGYPENVLTFKPTSDSTMGIRVNGGNLISIKWVNPDTISEEQNRPLDLIYGLFDIQIQVSESGKTATAEIYFQEPADSGLSWIKYQADKGWYDYKDNAAFNSDRTTVTLTFTDGGIGDDDGIADRIINDPSGLGRPAEDSTEPADEGGDGDGGGGCFINSVL